MSSVRDVAGTVLISPYSSIADIAAVKFWFLPARLILKDPFPSSDWAAEIKSPLLGLHGTKDRVISIEFGRKLKERVDAAKSAKGQPVMEWVELPNSDHNDWMLEDGGLAFGKIRDFVSRILETAKNQRPG